VWKWLLGTVIVLALLVVGGGVYLVKSGTLDKLMESFRPDSQGQKVRVEPAGKGTLVRTVSAPGIIEPRTKVDISAQVAARIVALPFREGQVVKKGDVLVRLDAVEYVALLESSKAQLKTEEARLEGARASLANARAELGRKRELFATKDISKSELDQAEAEYLRAESNYNASLSSLDIARANIQRAQKDLDNTTISAPMDGVITKLNAEVGELVLVGTLNNAASVIMQVADLRDLLVKAKVDEANIAPVRAGQGAKVFLNAYPDRPFSATVERVKLIREVDKDGTAYFQTELKLELPPDVDLFSGMTCNTDIGVETMYDVLLVPSQAILDRKTDELPKSVVEESAVLDRAKKFARVVYVMEGGKAVARPVSVGASDLTRTVVLAGLKENEKIVSGPFKALLTLKDGQKLEEEGVKAPEAGAVAEGKSKDGPKESGAESPVAGK
jgi:HlyD family secretion protein